MTIKHVPLHVHTEYSILDGASHIDDLVGYAKELELPALAITDHGVMYGCHEFLHTCRNNGIKPILGSEVYVINADHKDKSQRLPLYHLVLLAKNDIGYKNLSKIVSEGCTEGFYYKPRISKEFVMKHSEGIIALTACLGGEVPNLLMSGNYEQAKQVAQEYKEVFGDDFYLEIQDHGIPEEKLVNKQIVQISKELNIKVVATNDSHYTRKNDAVLHDVILCMQILKYVTDFPRMKFSGTEYLKSGDEMSELFEYIDDKELIRQAIEDNTLEIADKISNYDELVNSFNHMPNVPVPEGETNESYLRKLCFEKAVDRYGSVTQAVEDRLNYELKIICDKGFPGYFLIVADFIKYARDNDIPVGPGRGSAAGSIIAYVLNITDIDPLRFDLLFERFLNPERESMPDIDTDFCIDKRGQVLDYVRALYGEDKVAQIITFNRLAPKAVIKDVSRAVNYPYRASIKLADSIPVVRGKPAKLSWMIENHPEFKQEYKTDEFTREMVDIASRIEGTNKTFGVHAAGVIISDINLTDIVPLARAKDGGIITQYSMNHLEKLGLLKMDFLGLRNLTIIKETTDTIEKTTGEKIDISQISLEDQPTFDLLSRGELSGVFQLETSPGVKQVAREMKPQSLEDISALIALYRPGPIDAGMIDGYIARKHGREEIKYDTPELESILDSTYGTIVYQEQIMQIAQKLAGFTLGQADLLRRAMGKKKPEEMLTYKQLFLDGCAERKIKTKVAESLFETMMAFAEYCFNKSHSVAYAFLSYQTAWLKVHYPVQYLTALMNSVSVGVERMRFYIGESRRLGIEVLCPDINVSEYNFTADPKRQEILFGLNTIKGMSGQAVDRILATRKKEGEFTSLLDFCKRVNMTTLNRRMLENLIMAGAFDRITKINKRSMIESLDTVIKQAEKSAQGQTDLFGILGNNTVEDVIFEETEKEEFPEEDLMKRERELLGFYITKHPLERYQDKIKYFTTHKVTDLKSLKNNDEVVLSVLLSDYNKKMTKSNKIMGVGQGEDLFGKTEVVFFQTMLDKYPELIDLDAQLLIKGRVQFRSEDEPSIIANEIQSLKDLKYLELELNNNSKLEYHNWVNTLMKLRKEFKKYSGTFPVIIKYNNKELLVNPQLWVDNSGHCLEELKKFSMFNIKEKALL